MLLTSLRECLLKHLIFSTSVNRKRIFISISKNNCQLLFVINETNRWISILLGRILAGCYWFCILIWVSTYTANLAAFFTVKNTQQGINNLEDVLRSSYKVGIRDSTTVSDFFKKSEYDKHRKIWHRIQTGNNKFKSTAQAIQWVRETEDSLFINDGPMLRHLANQPPCDLVSGKI